MLAPIIKMSTGLINRILKYLGFGENNQKSSLIETSSEKQFINPTTNTINNENPTWIETGYGDQFENPTSKTINKLLTDLPDMDDEHGVFWIGDENENTIEIHKNGKLFYELSNPNLKGDFQMDSSVGLSELFIAFNDSDIEKVREILRKITGANKT
ncbi:hypothetical protein LCGC14_0218520 [marine sediment metagenome]|uniref:Uncharacterized protein n=2 Tax=root TaxID=1 RepID=A0A0F9UIN6_9ZZZZ